jgi:hypothetical protein
MRLSTKIIVTVQPFFEVQKCHLKNEESSGVRRYMPYMFTEQGIVMLSAFMVIYIKAL